MTRLSIGSAKAALSDTVNRVAYGGERVVLNRRGKDVAALVSIEDLRLLEQLEEAQDLSDARAALAEAREKGTVSWEQLKADLGL